MVQQKTNTSLLDNFDHFDIPIFDAKAQVFNPRSWILRALMLKPRFSISDLRFWSPDSPYRIFDAKAQPLRNPEHLNKFFGNELNLKGFNQFPGEVV